MKMTSPLPVDNTMPKSRQEARQRHARNLTFSNSAIKISSSALHPESLLSTGYEALDQLLQGGIPRGKVVEITGTPSCGKTSLTFSILAQATEEEDFVAYVDAFDSLDPVYAKKAGVYLQRLLWIRCRRLGTGCLNQALKAVDILAQAGGFGVILLDITAHPSCRDASIYKIPMHSWFRTQRAIKGTSTTLLILSSQRTSGSAATCALSLQRKNSCWSSYSVQKNIPSNYSSSVAICTRNDSKKGFRRKRSYYLQGITSTAHMVRGRDHGSIQVHCHF